MLTTCREPCLAEMLSDGPLTRRQSADLVGGLALAVEALAGAQLVARELTPDHVHLDPRRGGVLADRAVPFELVNRLALEADPHLAYRSPEELEGLAPDLRSNVYSLGVLLFTALVGTPPFGGKWSNIYLRHLNGDRPRASDRRRSLGTGIDDVIAQAMAADPVARFERPTELARAAAEGLRVALTLEGLAPQAQTAPGGLRVSEPARLPAGVPIRPASSHAAAGESRPVSGAVAPAPSTNGTSPEPTPEPPAATPEPRTGSHSPPTPSFAGPYAVRIGSALPGSGHVLARSWLRSAARSDTPRLTTLRRVGSPRDRRPNGMRNGGTARPPTAGDASPGLPRVPRKATAERESVASTTAPIARPRHRQTLVMLAAGGLAGVAAAAAMAFGSSSSDANTRISANGLSLALPAGWEQRDPSGARLPGVKRAIAGAPSERRRGGVVAALVSDHAAASAEIRGLSAGGIRRTPARLGPFQAWRYTPRRPAAASIGTAYMSHTSAGALVILCRARRTDARPDLNACAEAASTIQVDRARPISRGAVTARDRAVRRALETLGQEHLSGRRRLASALIADEQIAAAEALEGNFRGAALRIGEVESPPGLVSLDPVVDSLYAAAGSYEALALAISAGNADDYTAARESILATEADLRSETAAVLGRAVPR